MSVIGIDFGNEACYVAVAKAGGIETLANDYSLRATPSCVAFAGNKRILGVAAKNQLVTNMKNTICSFKHFLGRQFDDPITQREIKNHACPVERTESGGIGIRMNYLGEERVFTPEQITAMLMTKLKETAVNALHSAVNDCVIAVPFYFTNAQRQALLDAASIAKWNVLRLINETTATALSYGFYKDDLPETGDKPKYVAFVDCGHSALQVSICAFTKGKLKMVSSACELIGGRDFDGKLAEHFSNEFVTKYRIDPRTNKRAYVRLLAEVEKIKKQMSANSTKLPLNIECFMNDMDVTSSLSRADMEEMCQDLFQRIEATLVDCLEGSKIDAKLIHSVEIVGGSTRIPQIKASIEKVFMKPASTTLNQDEAVSRGAALMCALMSPIIRVREFSVLDIQNYPVQVMLEGDDPNNKPLVMEVFPRFHSTQISREVCLHRSQPFKIYAFYSEPETLPFKDQGIGTWLIGNVKPNAKGEPQEVKIKFKLSANGTVTMTSAYLVEKKDPPPEEPKEETPMEGQEAAGDGGGGGGTVTDSVGPDVEPNLQSPSSGGGGVGSRLNPLNWFSRGNAEADKKKEKEKKITSVHHELKVETQTHGFTPDVRQRFVDSEIEMISNDLREQERVNAKNALEEYVYEGRNKLSEDGPLHRYVLESDREQLVSILNNMENWIYEDGEDCEEVVYKGRLGELHDKIDPIESRCFEHEQQPSDLDRLTQYIHSANDVIGQYKAKDTRYDHLTEADMVNIGEAASVAERWLNDYRPKLMSTPKHVDPPKKLNEINEVYLRLYNSVNPIVTRPKPKVQPPPAQKPAAEEQQQPQGEQQPTENGEKKDQMDID